MLPFFENMVSASIYPGHRNPGKFVDSGYLVSARNAQRTRRQDRRRPRPIVQDGGALQWLCRDRGSMSISVRAKPNSTASTAMPPTNPILASARSATPPFYAVAVWPADIAVSTGLATDADARVLGSDGQPIPGLYACGNDMASVMAEVILDPARRSARPSCSLIVPRCMPRSMDAGKIAFNEEALTA